MGSFGGLNSSKRYKEKDLILERAGRPQACSRAEGSRAEGALLSGL